MGVVYRATDVLLGRPVAIKVLSRQLATQEQAKARFWREAKSASALDHPNIGAIYDIGEIEGELFIVMALYEGETLKERIAHGAVSLNEAIEILRQITRGLEAAHQIAIVHRDIKPANVIVTRGGTTKILDFGLAKLFGEASAQALTQTGEPAGTPMYMSPEQLRGQPLDQRTDLWSLGVLAYELLAGVSPFRADSYAAISLRILQEDPPSLLAVPGVPEWLAKLVEQLLRKDPAERPSSATEVLQILERGSVTTAPVTPRSRVVFSVAVLAMLTVIATATFILRARTATRPELPLSERVNRSDYDTAGALPGSSPIRRPVLAIVAKVHNQQVFSSQAPSSGQLQTFPGRQLPISGALAAPGTWLGAWLSTALTELLERELVDRELLRIVDRERMRLAEREIEALNQNSVQGLKELLSTVELSHDTLARIRNLTGADYVLTFRSLPIVNPFGSSVTILLQDTATGEKLSSFREAGLPEMQAEREPRDMSTKLNAHLRRLLGRVTTTPTESPPLSNVLPANSEGARMYSAGLVTLETNLALAREALEHAVRIEPEFPLAHRALGRVLRELGLESKAREEAELAFSHSEKLSRELQLLVEAEFHEANAHWEKAGDTLHTLVELFPDAVNYAFEVARVQLRAGRPTAARETVFGLRRLSLTPSEDVSVDFQEALLTDDLQESRDLSAKAAAKADALGARWLAARAKSVEASKSAALGELSGALTAATESERLFRDMDERKDLIGSLLTKAQVLLLTGAHWQEAFDAYEEARRIAIDLHSPLLELESTSQLAAGLMDAGEVKEARLRVKQIDSIASQLDSANATSTLRRLQGQQSLLEGRLADSSKLLDEAQELSHDNPEIAQILSRKGVLFLYRGDSIASRKAFEHALSIYKNEGVRTPISLVQTNLAEVALAEKRFKDAEEMAAGAIIQMKEVGLLRAEADARLVLGRATLAQGRREEATRAAERAAEISNQTSMHIQALGSSILRARILAASGQSGDIISALRLISQSISEARQRELRFVEFEARQAAAEIEMQAHRPEGRVHLNELKRAAAKAGFGLFLLDAIPVAGQGPRDL
jgi:serine/threonine protein kinase/tetratricopeptide (TPR) repeat protein